MKKIIFTMAALSLTAFVNAQDYGFGDYDSSSSFSGESYEEDSTPAVSISGEVGADVRAWAGSTNDDGEFDTKNYDSFYDLSKSTVDSGAHANVELNYDGSYTSANIKLKMNSTTLNDYPEDIIDEASLSGSFKDGRIQVKAGKLKEVWGKGDKIHVLDNFNANDYTDFIFPDYIDRRIGEIMFKTTANLSWDYNLKLEGIYTPKMTADRFAEDGMLVPYSMTSLTSTVKGILKDQAVATFISNDPDAIVDGVMGLSDFSTDSLFEDDINSLKYGQAGLRLTGTLGGIDWGTSYYYGHYKQPSVNLENVLAYKVAYATAIANGATRAQALTGVSSYLENALPSLNYDQLQTFGLEAAFVVWKLNTRWEAAYNLTEDYAGDNPWVKNNSVAWVAGFDIDLPIHNLNLNVQETGTYILHSDKIKEGTYAAYDVDYNSDKKYMNNKLIVLLSDKFLNERLTTEVQGIYCFECEEFMIAPKVEYNISEGLTFGLRGVYLYSDNENGEFYNFTQDSKNHDKAYLELTAKYQF